jgi:hypothetical protein
MQGNLFWQLGALSDEALLDGLNRVVVSGRRLLAQLLAHLCEVENRRLHLDAGYPSMFAYCTGRLGLSEDEAYRRIEVARLARRVPMIFQLIAEGRLSLSAAALLKPHLLASNLPELVHAVSGQSVQAARQALAAFFPRPDVVDSIRKLPEREPAPQRDQTPSLFGMHSSTSHLARSESPASADDTATSIGHVLRQAATVPFPEPSLHGEKRAPLPRGSSLDSVAANLLPPRPQALEPLSPGRYKVSFTASGTLKEKLELARDLMRHSIPDGDLATILERALDLLITDRMKHRFGAGSRARRSAASNDAPGDLLQTISSTHHEKREVAAQPTPPATDNYSMSETVPRAVRRAILERDGLRCTWRGPDGTQCSARAWLERDHRRARSLGGPTHLENLRHLCRAHNRRAAEHIHGSHHIERAIRRKRATHPTRQDQVTRSAPSNSPSTDAPPPTAASAVP